MFVNTERYCCLVSGADGVYGRVVQCIPELDGTILRTTHQFTNTTTLHVKVENGTVMLTPAPDGGLQAMFTLVVDTDCTVFETSADKIALDLVGRNGGDSCAGESTDFLKCTVNAETNR